MAGNRKLPKVGVGVIVRRDRKVLVGQRLNAHGHGSWSFPGGHLEYAESIEDCALREVLEETGLRVKYVRFGSLTNDVFTKEAKHYITIYVVCDWVDGHAQLKEPNKMCRWQWVEWDNLPAPLFLPINTLIASRYSPFDD